LNQEIFDNFLFIFIVLIIPLVFVILFYLILKILNPISGKSNSAKFDTLNHYRRNGLKKFSIGYLRFISIVILLSYQVSLLFLGCLIVLSSISGEVIAMILAILIFLFIINLSLIYRVYSETSK
jgi:NADH:ubiquinone oxidoreductase subunit 3 (subunit A)